MTALAPSRAAGAVKAAVAALIALAILIGMPAILIAAAGAPWEWQAPSSARLEVALSWPISANTIKWGMVIAAWAVWVCLGIALAREIVLQIAGRRSVAQIRGPIRLLTAMLIGSVTATAPAWSASAETTSVAESCNAPDTAAPPAADDEQPADSGQAETTDAVVIVDRHNPDAATLWGMAQDHYDDGTKYNRIFNANKGITQSDGSALTDEDHIIDGTAITIPGTTPPSAPVEAPPAPIAPPQPDDDTAESPDPAADADPSQETSDDHLVTQPAFDRGAWITVGSFIALSAAAAVLVRHRRNRAKQPPEPTESAESDTSSEPGDADSPDDVPFTGRLVDLEALLEQHRVAEADHAPEPALSTGTTATGEILILDHAHGGVGLTGAGAPGVALTAIWSALASGATVVTDAGTATGLGLHIETALPIELRVVQDPEDLAVAVHMTQSRIEYDVAADTLAQRATIIVTDRATAEALPTALLDDADTYAIILGAWDGAWIEVAADGTPVEGRLDAGPIAELGQCYLLDVDTCNDLIADLTTTPTAAATETGQTPQAPPDTPSEEIEQDTPDQDATHEADDSPRGRFELTMFGRLRLTWDGEEVHFSRSACINALAVLALHDGRMSADELSEAITPDASISQAAARRTSTISAARVALQTLTGTKGQKEQFITYDRVTNSYHLDRTWFHTDLEAATDRLAKASASDDPTERAGHLQAALHHYAGPLAADLDDVWDLIDLRRHWQQALYDAALDLAALYGAAGQHDRCTATFERAIAIDPDATEAWQQLTAHHRRTGEAAKADDVEARAHHHRATTNLTRHHQDGESR